MAITERIQPQGRPAEILDGWVDRAELARQFGKHERTIRRWERLRIAPPHVKQGCDTLYNIPIARAWLRAKAESGE